MQEILAASGVTHPARAQLIRRVSELHNDISGLFYGKYVGGLFEARDGGCGYQNRKKLNLNGRTI